MLWKTFTPLLGPGVFWKIFSNGFLENTDKSGGLTLSITLCAKKKWSEDPRRFDYQFLIVFGCWVRKKYSFLLISVFAPNSREKPRNMNFSAVFAILNIRNRVRSILFVGINRQHQCDDFAKGKSRKCWKLQIWWSFKFQNFEFFDHFSEIFDTNIFFSRKIC